MPGKAVRAKSSRQVTSAEEKDYLRSVVYAWTNGHRKAVIEAASEPDIQAVDREYDRILTATSKDAARTTYAQAMKNAKEALVTLRSSVLLQPRTLSPTGDAAPTSLHWLQTPRCRTSLHGAGKNVSFASQRKLISPTVMMGGLLEALFVARANRMQDKSPLFNARATPIDAQTKKALQLKDWTLRPYIDVGHELGWITKSGREVAAVLRDYRNYVHPEKERSHGVSIGEADSAMFWEITKLLARQLLST